MKSMILELAIPKQSQEIATQVNQAYRGKFSWTKEGYLVNGDRISSRKVKDIILNENSYLFIVRDSANIISCICIKKQKKCAYFGLLAVKPKIQSKGIGKKF